MNSSPTVLGYYLFFTFNSTSVNSVSTRWVVVAEIRCKCGNDKIAGKKCVRGTGVAKRWSKPSSSPHSGFTRSCSF